MPGLSDAPMGFKPNQSASEEQRMHHVFTPCEHGVPTDEPCAKCVEEHKSEELKKTIEHFTQADADREHYGWKCPLIEPWAAKELLLATKQLQQLMNNGPKCGACAEQLFCGSTMYQHDADCVYTKLQQVEKERDEYGIVLDAIGQAIGLVGVHGIEKRQGMALLVFTVLASQSDSYKKLEQQLSQQSADVEKMVVQIKAIRNLCDYRYKQDQLCLAAYCIEHCDEALSPPTAQKCLKRKSS